MRAWQILGVATVSAAALVGSAMAQEKAAEPAPGQDMPMVKPGPEHAILKQDVGVWDATVESTMEPGGTPEISKGVETNVLLGEGLWLIQDYRGEFLGMPFLGHTISGYDPFKQKYVGSWVDTMSPGVWATEGTYDPATQTMTTWMEGPCPTGQIMKMRSTCVRKDAHTRVFSMYSPAEMGEPFVMMKITYTRRAKSADASVTN